MSTETTPAITCGFCGTYTCRCTETKPKRPWAVVAPWPQDNDPVKLRAHFSAQCIAHDAAIHGFNTDDDESIRLAARHNDIAIAAFAAACAGDPAWTLRGVGEAIDSFDAALEYAYQWVRAAGIDPDEIEAAGS